MKIEKIETIKQKRVIIVDVGNMSKKEAGKYLQKMFSNYMKATKETI